MKALRFFASFREFGPAQFTFDHAMQPLPCSKPLRPTVVKLFRRVLRVVDGHKQLLEGIHRS